MVHIAAASTEHRMGMQEYTGVANSAHGEPNGRTSSIQTNPASVCTIMMAASLSGGTVALG